ncbi:MAG: ABC transporter substrate-binding protein [Geitlerinemataceae cyanobacterium]
MNGFLRRWFRFRAALVALVVCGFVVACGGSVPTPTTGSDDCRTVSHSLGQMEICDRPEAIAVFDIHSLDLLLSLGQQPSGVVTALPVKADRITQPNLAIPYLGDRITTEPLNLATLGQIPSLETVVRLNPDLIVGESWNIQGASSVLSEIAPALPLAPRSEKGNWRDNLQALAVALGDEALADAAIERYEQQVQAARAEFAEVVAAHPKVLLLTGESLYRGAIYVLTGEGFIGELLEEIGFEMVEPPGVVRNFMPSSIEILPDLEADLVFVLGYSSEPNPSVEPNEVNADALIDRQLGRIRDDWQANPIAQSLSASRNDRVYFRTFYEWNVLNGPLGAELILQQLRQILL